MIRKIVIAAFILFGFVATKSYSQESSSGNKTRNIEYVPKNYEMNKIDTIINDTIRLAVKHYTLMDSYATAYKVIPDSIGYRYRDYEIEIDLTINKKEIINKRFQKSDFIPDEKYWPNLTLFKVWLKSSDIGDDQIKLRVGIGIPNFNTPLMASLMLGYDGKINIKLK